MEKTDIVDEDDIANDDKPIGGKHNTMMAVSAYKHKNKKKRKSENCRKRNILQRDESIRKEVVREVLLL